MVVIFTVEFSVNSVREDTDDALASILLHLIRFYWEFIAFYFQIIWITNRYLVGRVHNELHTSITTNWQLTLVKNRAIHSRFTSRVTFAERDPIWISFCSQQIAPETQQFRPAICHVLTNQVHSASARTWRLLDYVDLPELLSIPYFLCFISSLYQMFGTWPCSSEEEKTGYENMFGSFINCRCFTNRCKHAINFWFFHFILSILFTIFMWNVMSKSGYYSRIYIRLIV